MYKNRGEKGLCPFLWWNYGKESVGDGVKTPCERKGKGRVSPGEFLCNKERKERGARILGYPKAFQG